MTVEILSCIIPLSAIELMQGNYTVALEGIMYSFVI